MSGAFEECWACVAAWAHMAARVAPEDDAAEETNPGKDGSLTQQPCGEDAVDQRWLAVNGVCLALPARKAPTGLGHGCPEPWGAGSCPGQGGPGCQWGCRLRRKQQHPSACWKMMASSTSDYVSGGATSRDLKTADAQSRSHGRDPHLGRGATEGPALPHRFFFGWCNSDLRTPLHPRRFRVWPRHAIRLGCASNPSRVS